MSLERLNQFNRDLFGSIWGLLNETFFMIGDFELTFIKFFLIIAVAWQLVYFLQGFFDFESDPYEEVGQKSRR